MKNKIICKVCRGNKMYQVSNLKFELCRKCEGKGYTIQTDKDLKGDRVVVIEGVKYEPTPIKDSPAIVFSTGFTSAFSCMFCNLVFSISVKGFVSKLLSYLVFIEDAVSEVPEPKAS